MTAATYVLAALACGLGSMLRFWLSTWRRPHHLPWPTLLANVLGTALLGAAASPQRLGPPVCGGLFVVGAGIAGGLTTFSTLAVDAVVLWRASRSRATMYVATTAWRSPRGWPAGGSLGHSFEASPRAFLVGGRESQRLKFADSDERGRHRGHNQQERRP